MQGRKTGPKPQFTAEDVAEAAIAEGVATFTLAQVASRLGVRAPSLYRVVSTRDQIVAMCFSRILRELPPPSSGARWETVLRSWTDHLWKLFERYPGLSRAVLDHPAATRDVSAHLASYVNGLLAGGFPGDKEEADFVLDFAGDTAIVTHIGITNLRSSATQHGCAPEVADGRGWLDRKIGVIIASYDQPGR